MYSKVINKIDSFYSFVYFFLQCESRRWLLIETSLAQQKSCGGRFFSLFYFLFKNPFSIFKKLLVV